MVWRILDGPNSIWSEISRLRYGDIKEKILSSYCLSLGKKNSIWWNNLINVCFNQKQKGNWFAKSISCKLGNIKELAYWKPTWMGTCPLCRIFPEAFDSCVDPLPKIMDLGIRAQGKWCCNLSSSFDSTVMVALSQQSDLLDLPANI